MSFLLQTGRCVHPFGKKSKLRKPINTWRYPLIQSHHYFMPKNGRVDVEIYMLSLEEYIRGQFYHLDLHIGVFVQKTSRNI